MAASLERLVMPGPLSHAHAEIEDDCGACHSPMADQPQFQLCVACHEKVGQDLSSGLGFHGKHPQVSSEQCQSCHREHEGRDAQTLAFDLTAFDHHQTNFPLVAAHESLTCEQCHAADTEFHEAEAQCVGCHAQDDPHDGQLGTQCDSCHWQSDWRAVGFDHATTGFDLHGAHALLSCDDCHIGTDFSAATSDCAACHDKDDVHQGVFGNACGDCHNSADWQASTFDHASATGFALDGQHAPLSCSSCHRSSERLSGSTCQSCHAEDDIHAGSLGSNCAACHTSDRWQPSGFDHSVFPLLGGHEGLACQQCHDKTASLTPTSCHACHSDPHQQQLGTQCESCHSETSWSHPMRFDHQLSHFPLLGRHAELSCEDCHHDLRFHDTAQQCHECHAEQDVHQGRLGTHCEQCHNPVDWRHTRFDHGAASSFALLGAHQDVACEACHDNQLFMRAQSPNDCRTCHAQDDPHDGQFGSDCQQCHLTQSFKVLR